jgi:hypothetical protein
MSSDMHSERLALTCRSWIFGLSSSALFAPCGKNPENSPRSEARGEEELRSPGNGTFRFDLQTQKQAKA